MSCKRCKTLGCAGDCQLDYPFPWWVLIIATALWTLVYLSIY